MAAAEKWRDATEAACARHKVALFGWTGCKPRDSMRLLEKMHNNIGSALKEKARRMNPAHQGVGLQIWSGR